MTTARRIGDLLGQMTLEEKIGQLVVLADCFRPFAFNVNPDSFQWKPERVLAMIRAGGVCGLFNGVGAKEGRELQRIAVEESRLGIPLLFGADVIHGMRTLFPIPLGEAASFEPALAERTARVMAIEATAEGLHWTFAPMVDVARDQRWGRVAEGAGEDTLLASRFAAARVRGFQGPDLRADDSLLATAKHFAAYGAVAAGLDYSSADLSPQTLHEVHLPPFLAAIRAGAMALMSSFNDVNGVPATANRELLTDLLRDAWGYEGLVIGDYTSDFELIAHGYAADGAEAAERCLGAGLDVSLQSDVYFGHLAALVRAGRVPEALVDRAAARVLRVKQALGLFDNPYRSLDPAAAVPPAQVRQHLELAREAARRSIVLLRNEGGVLPLARGARIALVGPFADDRRHLAGCWNIYGDPSRDTDLAAGLRAALPQPAQLRVERGCDFEAPLAGGIDAALAACRAADVVVLALGEPTEFTGEAQSRTHIGLPEAQLELARAVRAAGKPVVLLLRNGRALELDASLRGCDAIVVTWFLGSMTGPAVADVLLGEQAPSGRLPVSFPHASGQQPYFYNHPASGRPHPPGSERVPFTTRWREVPHGALYPFGHGLTYTTFEYGPVEPASATLPWDGVLRVRARVANTGTRAGEEVVQLYVRDRVASRVRPVRELKDFRKVRLEPGASALVEFELRRADLVFHDPANRPVAEPGEFDVWIAPSSAAGAPARFTLLPP